MAPLFSVVIPTYNQADYLRKALKCVLEQTFQDFEVVVVNNYSTDSTLDVVREFEDPRVRLINYRNNGIIGASRNMGIRSTKGEYVAFLDSDDLWYQNKLARVAQALEEEPEAGLVSHDQVQVREGHKDRRTWYGPPEGYAGSLYRYLLLVSNGPSTSATVVARRYLEQVGLFSEDPAFVTVEDYDLWLRLSKVCTFRFLRDVLGAVLLRPDSASTNAELHLRNAMAVLDFHFSQMDKVCSKVAKRHRYAHVYNGAAREHQRQRAMKKALGYYLRTFWAYPFCPRLFVGLSLLLGDAAVGRSRSGKIADALWEYVRQRGAA